MAYDILYLHGDPFDIDTNVSVVPTCFASDYKVGLQSNRNQG